MIEVKRMKTENAWKKYADKKPVFDFCEGYKEFMSLCKTERECTDEIIKQAKKAGFKNLDTVIEKGETLKKGDKVYANNMGKALALFVIGEKPIQEGMRILGAHIDSPRLDLKQNPLYEEAEQALLDTHYYGGVKKYQWVTLPMALHGVVVKEDGTKVNVVIGESKDDPVVGISDLLIHLSAKQMQKKATEVIEGENLNVLVGSIPLEGEETEGVKENILSILKEKYEIEEKDFVSAELEVVPAGEARDFGLDRSMIMAYGQDDRVCAYPSYKAIEAVTEAEYTSVCLLVDKEEIGSVGATGMHSRFFEDTVAEVVALTGGNALHVRRALGNSAMLSSDVSAAFDPLYADAFEKKNTAYFGRGLVFNKFTGSRGKNNSNDANAEYIAKVRQVLDNNEVGFQTAEMGRVDLGGGGTIAYIMANYGMNVIDSGVAVLSMHAPYEVTSKADIYEAYRGYKAFLKDIK